MTRPGQPARIGAEPAGGFDPVEPRHPDVHQDDGRSQRARLLDRSDSVVGLTHDIQV
jgi:hypothetical protein